MSRNEALAHIESESATNGMESAYKAFNEEVNKINRCPDEQQKQTQLADLGAGLKKDGLLPDLAVYWGAEHIGLVGNGRGFSLRDLDEYRNRATTDAMSKVMTNSLMEQHDALRKAWWDGDDTHVTLNDLHQQESNHRYAGRDFGAKHEIAKFAEELKANNYELFNKLSGGDGRKDDVTGFDMRKALAANEEAKKFGHPFLTDDEVKSIKEAEKSMPYVKDPYIDSRTGGFTLDKLKALAPREKAAYEEDADASPHINTTAAMDALRRFIQSSTGLHLGADPAAQAHNAHAKVAEVHDGDGFDRIARRELHKLHGDDVSESDVLKYSDQIAKFNGQTGGRQESKISKNMKVMLPEFKQD